MASSDKSLEEHFKEFICGRRDQKNLRLDSKRFGTLEDLNIWFQEIEAFDKLNIQQSDVEEFSKNVYEKYRTPFTWNKAQCKITFQDFNRILDELAVRINLEPEELKSKLVYLRESRALNESAFEEMLKKCQESVGNFTDWLWNTKVFGNMKVAKAELIEAFKYSQENVGKLTYEEFRNGVKKIADKHGIGADELLESVVKSWK